MNKKKKINYSLVVIVSIILIVVVVTIFQSLIKKEDKMIIKKTSLYQYTGDTKLKYTGNVEIDKNNDITTINFHGLKERVTLDTTPVYYVKEKKVIFPKNMSIIFPRTGQQFRINYFSYMTKNEYNDVRLKDRTVEKLLDNCIIYDGYDLYFLIGDYTVTVNNNTYNLSSFSYLRVDTYNGYVEIYDYDNDKMEVINTEEEIIIENENFKVNGTLDLMYYNETSRLLIKKVDKLKNYS